MGFSFVSVSGFGGSGRDGSGSGPMLSPSCSAYLIYIETHKLQLLERKSFSEVTDR